MNNLSIKKLYKLYHKAVSENYSDSDLDTILELINKQELNENTSATGGPSGDAGSSTVGYGSIGVGLRTTVGPSANPQISGNISGSDWINGVKKTTSPMGKGHGARTGKKSRVKPLDLK